ncbi:TetR/AcrR family transcriptional regulator [Microbacterium sediminicola]|uniref:TetR/AcrR family transcriptional regulator n=1 Tax=Microbacterium sediminicola TaxID=415210 RepID=A0ABP4U9P2_9MICO
MTVEAPSPDAVAPARLGRPRDASRDADILEATLEVLAEHGYDGMTIDMVAAHAGAGKATVYRRWPSKADLVIDAVACMKMRDIDLENLPDTGSLRGDLVALVRAPELPEAERKMRVMGGVISLMSREPELAQAVYSAILAPRITINRALLQRAKERGEIRQDADVDKLAALAPAMTAFRTLAERKPVDRAFLLSLIDDVVLPAAGVATPTVHDGP